MTDLENFYPKYPFVRRPVDERLDTYPSESFNDAVVTKREFASLQLSRTEPIPTRPGEYLAHQKYIARYMASSTGYDELLLFHEPGTGKTCTAVALAESIKADRSSNIRRAMVFAKGEGLLNNFRDELVFRCTDGRYVPRGYTTLTELQRVRRLRQAVSDFYAFDTFETFAKRLAELTDDQIRTRYEDSLLIVDEAHNLRYKSRAIAAEEERDADPDDASAPEDTSPLDVYDQFYRLFHALKRRKILLLTGTPIRDLPEEFAAVMNLILPVSARLPDDFAKLYLTSDGALRPGAREAIASKIVGRVSYLKSAVSEVKKLFVGSVLPGFKHFRLYAVDMSDFQTRHYAEAYASDERTRSIFSASRQASLLVYPDGSYGQTGFERYVKKIGRGAAAYELTRDMRNACRRLDELRRYSCKYASVVTFLLDRPFFNTFIYVQYVNGSGAIALAKILELYGYAPFIGTETTPGRRYLLATRQTMSVRAIQRALDRFNKDDNAEGAYCSVVIGSRVLNEGFTIKNVRRAFVLTGHWNDSETTQAIARGWRVGSHSALLRVAREPIEYEVYQYVSVPDDSSVSVDVEMYRTAEAKDVINRSVERLVKELAFDCPLAIDRNTTIGYDGQRECDYGPCRYRCDGSILSPLDSSTYDLANESIEETMAAVDRRLKEVFSSRFVYPRRSLKAALGDAVDSFLVARAVSRLIETGAVYRDAHGFEKFLRYGEGSLFLSDLPPSIDGSASTSYYSESLLLERRAPFHRVLADRVEKSLPDAVQRLFDYPLHARRLVVGLPYDVQRLLLESCLIAREIVGATENAAVRDDLLSFYAGFYSRRRVAGKKRWVVTLHEDSLGGPSCYDGRSKKFIACDVEPTTTTARKPSPVGYYGQYNPSLDDFCLRDVSAEMSSTDLRKLAVGRRCVNFDSASLVDLVARRMVVDPPESFVVSPSRPGRYGRPDDDEDTTRRVAYWSTQSKRAMCERAKRWFVDNDLLETNFDCGSQRKRRAKFRI